MSFEQLKQSILEEADKKSQAVADDFYEQLVKEETRVKNQARATEERIMEQAAVKGQGEAKRLYQEAALQMRALVLSAKQEEIDKTKELFKKQLLEGDKTKVKALLTKLVKNIPNEEGVIVLGEKNADELKKILDKSNIKIEKETIPNEGGLIYRNKTMELNLTISQLVNDLFSRHRTEIAKALFN